MNVITEESITLSVSESKYMLLMYVQYNFVISFLAFYHQFHFQFHHQFNFRFHHRLHPYHS